MEALLVVEEVEEEEEDAQSQSVSAVTAQLLSNLAPVEDLCVTLKHNAISKYGHLLQHKLILLVENV